MTQLTGKLEPNLFNSAKLAEKTVMLQLDQWKVDDTFSGVKKESFSEAMSSRMNEPPKQVPERQDMRREPRRKEPEDDVQRNSNMTRDNSDVHDQNAPTHRADQTARDTDTGRTAVTSENTANENSETQDESLDTQAQETAKTKDENVLGEGDRAVTSLLTEIDHDGAEQQADQTVVSELEVDSGAILAGQAAVNGADDVAKKGVSSSDQDTSAPIALKDEVSKAAKTNSPADTVKMLNVNDPKTLGVPKVLTDSVENVLDKDTQNFFVKSGLAKTTGESESASLKDAVAQKETLKSNLNATFDTLRSESSGIATKTAAKTLNLEAALINAGMVVGQKSLRAEADTLQTEKALNSLTGQKLGASSVLSSEFGSSLRTQNIDASTQKLTIPVTVKVGQSQWAGQLAERTAWLASQKLSSADIQLDPPELGPISVKVHVQQEQASVSFVSHNPNVREALDQSVARLREMFQQEGMNLVDVNVSDQSKEQQSSDDTPSNELRGSGVDSGSDVSDSDDVQVVEVPAESGIDHFV